MSLKFEVIQGPYYPLLEFKESDQLGEIKAVLQPLVSTNGLSGRSLLVAAAFLLKYGRRD